MSAGDMLVAAVPARHGHCALLFPSVFIEGRKITPRMAYPVSKPLAVEGAEEARLKVKMTVKLLQTCMFLLVFAMAVGCGGEPVASEEEVQVETTASAAVPNCNDPDLNIPFEAKKCGSHGNDACCWSGKAPFCKAKCREPGMTLVCKSFNALGNLNACATGNHGLCCDYD